MNFQRGFWSLLVICLLAISVAMAVSNQDDSVGPQLNLEEAGVQHLESKLRYALDRAVFPPVGKGTSSDPGVLRGALSSIFGGNSIMNRLEEQPKVYLKVVNRIESWNPDYPSDYNPGWKYTHRLDKAAIAKEVADAREKLLPALRKKATLLNDPRFQDALVKLQENEKRINDRIYSRTNDKPRLSPWEYHDVKVRERTKLHLIEWELIPASRWHAKVGWKAENYFTDTGVIELCQAIQANDLRRMRELIDEGTNVNAIGKDNMTPLLWSFPDLKFERFQMLLQAGANPNVIAAARVKPKFQLFQPRVSGSPAEMFADFTKGSSVNLMAYQTLDTRYWRAVLKHGGDVNQIGTSKRSLLHMVLGDWRPWKEAETEAAVKALVEKGANLNTLDSNSRPPLSIAIMNNKYELATFLVQSGATLTGQHHRHSKKSPIQLVQNMKPFGYYFDDPASSEELNVQRRKAAISRGVRQQALHDAMVQQGAIFEADQISVDRGLAKSRASRLKELTPRLKSEQRLVPGETSTSYTPAKRYDWRDYGDPARNREFSKYYAHTSPDFSKPSNGINFSIKHVSTNQLKDVKTSLPEFAAIGSRNDSSILIAPSFSGHSDWLEVHGGVWEGYLRHLAVKKCNLLNRTSADFPELATNTEGYYFVEVANDKRHNELLIPAQYLQDEALRRKTGLEAFGEIWKIIDDYKMRAFIGSQQRAGDLVAEVNKQLKSQFPDVKFRFYIEHLTAANLDANDVLACTFEFSESGTNLKYTASCKRNRWANDYQLTVEVTRQ